MKTTVPLLAALLAALCLAGCFTPLDKEGMVYTPPEVTETPAEEKTPSPEEREAIAAAIRPVPVLIIETEGGRFTASFEKNSSADALAEALSREPITIGMHDYGGFEKVGDLPWELPRNDERITAKPGDVILYQGRQLTVYYGTNTWDFTRVARIDSVTGEELLEAFGEGDVSVTFRVEWSE